MGKNPSIGETIGFSALIAVVVVFVVIVAVYAIYVHCWRKPHKLNDKPKPKKKANRKVKAKKELKRGAADTGPTAGDVAWQNPLVELEQVLDDEDRKIEEASQLGSEIPTTDSGYQNGTLERQQPEILEEEPDYIRNSKVFAERNVVDETTHQQPVTSHIHTLERPQDVVIAMDTLERRETRDLKRSNSILDRVGYFECAENSLVRPAKGKELEGIKPKVVTGLVTDFEKSDNILLGRQAPEAGDIHIMHVHTIDPGTGEPVYAVLDRNRKSQQRQARPESRVSETSDQSLPTPQIPNKPNYL